MLVSSRRPLHGEEERVVRRRGRAPGARRGGSARRGARPPRRAARGAPCRPCRARARLLLEVDVREVERDRLRAAQAGRVDELDERAVPQAERPVAGERVDHRLDLAALRRVRKVPRPAWRECASRARARAECVKRRSERTADELAGDRGRREPVPAAAELGRVLGQRADVDVLPRLVPLEPGREAAQVAAVRARRRQARPPGAVEAGGSIALRVFIASDFPAAVRSIGSCGSPTGAEASDRRRRRCARSSA